MENHATCSFINSSSTELAFGSGLVPGVPHVGVGGVVLAHPRPRLVDRLAVDSEPRTDVAEPLL